MEYWYKSHYYGTDRATLRPSLDGGWFVDMGCSLWDRYYKSKKCAENYLVRCGYAREEQSRCTITE